MTMVMGLLKKKIGAIEPKVIRFLLVGGFNAFLGLTLFPTIYWTFPAYRSNYLWMMAACHIACVFNSYMTNKYLVFRTQGYNSAEIGKFVFFHFSYFLVALIVVPILVKVTHINPVIFQFSLSVLVIICSFFWYDKIVFLAKKEKYLA